MVYSLYPGSSCQNTSLAMLLTFYGWQGTPDDITSRYGKSLAQSPGGLATVFNELASESGLAQRLVPHTDGTPLEVRQLVEQGKPVIVHGWFTPSGHLMVVTGFDDTTYTTNDPAGVWSESFEGSYPGPYDPAAGHGVRYGRVAFDQAINTSDGATSDPVWYHEVK